MSTAVETGHKVVSREEWAKAHAAHLTKEKEFTRQRDELSRQRRELPWVKVEKNYVFDGAKGKETLSDLFDGRSQLLVYHFMLGPEWQEGCIGCSFHADHMDGAIQHLVHHDVNFVAVSRAPFAKIKAFQKRMGWRFKWVSSYLNDFNFDHHVSFSKDDRARGRVYYNFAERDFESDELPGISVFYKNENSEIFHSFSSYARGLDILLGTYNYLDITPKGRNEARRGMDWVKHHDRYEGAPSSSGCHGDHP
jgi:predicted dithiol-disulfide oxidoreductase (DUF899 family)